jgi:hypothetical protein
LAELLQYDAWKSHVFDRATKLHTHIRDEDLKRKLRKIGDTLTCMAADAQAGKCVELVYIENVRGEGRAAVIRDALIEKNASLAPFITTGDGCIIFRVPAETQ